MISTKFIFLCLLIYITAGVLFLTKQRQDRETEADRARKNALTVTLSILGIGVLFMLWVMGLKSESLFSNFGLSGRNLWSIFKISAVLLTVVGIFIGIMFAIFSSVKQPPTSSAFFEVLNFLIFATTVLFLGYMVKDVDFQNPFLRLIKDIVFYIPCLFYDLIEWAKYQYSITTPTALIILGIDLVFITLNYVWGKLHRLWEHHKLEDGLLLEGPVYLNEKRILGNFEDLKEVRGNKNFTYHYGLSFEIYINPQPPNTNAAYNEYAKLFDYGHKPTLLYKANENKLKIQVRMNENETRDIYLGDIMKLQRWNKFLINYDHGTLDIFLNGKLLSSASSMAPYMTLDVVSVGQTNGINGGIRNVLYFRDPVV
jgi:hypothetical protein